MIRTQISLDEESYREAKGEAGRQGISLAEFLRRAVAMMLRDRRTQDRPWMAYAGVLESGDRSASEAVDTVVYGGKGRL